MKPFRIVAVFMLVFIAVPLTSLFVIWIGWSANRLAYVPGFVYYLLPRPGANCQDYGPFWPWSMAEAAVGEKWSGRYVLLKRDLAQCKDDGELKTEHVYQLGGTLKYSLDDTDDFFRLGELLEQDTTFADYFYGLIDAADADTRKNIFEDVDNCPRGSEPLCRRILQHAGTGLNLVSTIPDDSQPTAAPPVKIISEDKSSAFHQTYRLGERVKFRFEVAYALKNADGNLRISLEPDLGVIPPAKGKAPWGEPVVRPLKRGSGREVFEFDFAAPKTTEPYGVVVVNVDLNERGAKKPIGTSSDFIVLFKPLSCDKFTEADKEWQIAWPFGGPRNFYELFRHYQSSCPGEGPWETWWHAESVVSGLIFTHLNQKEYDNAEDYIQALKDYEYYYKLDDDFRAFIHRHLETEKNPTLAKVVRTVAGKCVRRFPDFCRPIRGY